MIIESTLKQAFRPESWLAILKEIFHYEHLSLRPTAKPLDIKTAFQENILSGLQLGDLSLADDNNVLLLHLRVQNKIDLSRNKIALRAFLIDLLDDSEFDAAIAVFEQDDNPNWRISYVSRSISLLEDGTHEEIQTAPRRFTFLVGKDEPTRTAARQLAEIKQAGDSLNLQKLETAFAFEKLSNEFFDHYKALYSLFLAHILPTTPYLLQAQHPFKKEKDSSNGRATPYPQHIPSEENLDQANATRALFSIATEATPTAQKIADKPIRDFVKKLLGRLVFLTFLEKKGWLGCPADSTDWTEGKRTFLQDYFAQAGGSDDAVAFHSDFLTSLFFEALNTERPDDLFEKTDTRIPYLNGGLFDSDPAPLQTIDFPPALFATLLDFFGQYNFTIDENDPLNKEVGIDPEMLGHIFENLLEDNKDKGAYYTPKPVVSYMCQQSLLHYLQTHLGERAELSELVTLHKAGDPEDPDSWCHQNAKKIATLLEKVKICDPAIGSGAFPIGMLNEIVHIRTLLNSEFHDPAERAALKKSIIQKSIYGVDLDLGAVEIARLRFWLALVVDEVTPSPLPNLDYKIMQGNSLLESFGGVDLSRIEQEADPRSMTIRQVTGGEAELNLLDQDQQEFHAVSSENRSAILEARQKYFNARKPERKAELRDTIDREVINHIRTCLEFDLDKVRNLIDQHQKITDGTLPKPKGWNARSAPKKLAALQKQKTDIEASHQQLEAVARQPERPFFLWHLIFQDVFAEGGFDIIIQNPPYLGEDGNKPTFDEILPDKLSKYSEGKMDFFYYFIHLTLGKLLKNKGVAYLITTSYFRSATGASKLRNHLKEECSFIELIDFGELKIFQSASGQHNLLYGFLRSSHSTGRTKLSATTRSGSSTDSTIHSILGGNDPDTHYLTIPSGNVFDSETSFIRKASLANTAGGGVANSVIEKLRQHHRLETIGNFTQGLVSGCDTVSKAKLHLIGGEAKAGDPVYVFDLTRDKDRLLVEKISNTDGKSFLKPFYKNSSIHKFGVITPHTKVVLYLPRGTDERALSSVILEHLKPYKKILELRREFRDGKLPWYQLHWPRDQRIFLKPGLVFPYRAPLSVCSVFSPPFYCRSDCYLFHLTQQCPVTLRSLEAIINSLCSTFWLREQGRLKGKALELFPAVLDKLPIPDLDEEAQNLLATLAEQCAQATTDNDLDSLAAHEDAINQIVYRLFDLTDDEIALIESTLAS